jgi:hypothetical protein
MISSSLAGRSARRAGREGEASRLRIPTDGSVTSLRAVLDQPDARDLEVTAMLACRRSPMP